MPMAEMFSRFTLSGGWLVCLHKEFNDKRAQGKEVNVHTHKTSAFIKRSYEIELHERTQSHIYDGAFSSIAKR